MLLRKQLLTLTFPLLSSLQATSGHLGLLKAKLAKLRRELLDGPKTGGSNAGKEFEVVKFGDARVALIAFPSVGKSTLLCSLTNTQSVVSAHGWSLLFFHPNAQQRTHAPLHWLYRFRRDSLSDGSTLFLISSFFTSSQHRVYDT